jgi:hypothetical protein
MASTTAGATVHIAASPTTLYDMVSDLPRMGEWSPENHGGRWLNGASAAAVGAKFRGHNHLRWRRWSTIATINAAERGSRLAFTVSVAGITGARWTYDFLASPGGGTDITERWEDLRIAPLRAISGVLSGAQDRGAHNQDGIDRTLAALKQAAETQTAS